MKYAFIAPFFIGNQLYYCQTEGNGFKLSTDLKDAILKDTLKEAKVEADRLRKQSGGQVEIKRIKVKPL